MKIVIDIDDEQVLFDIKNRGLEAQTETDKVIINALYNGTPLPKVHGDLIDKNELIKMYEKDCGRRIYADNFIFDLENNTTTIIEADKEKEE